MLVGRPHAPTMMNTRPLALVFFKVYTSREGQEARTRRDQDRARLEMFARSHEKQDVGGENAQR